MESPVRIYLSAALVVHMVLLSSSNVQSSAIPPSTPPESKATTLNIQRTPFSKSNSSSPWLSRKIFAKPKEAVTNTLQSQEDENESSSKEQFEITAKPRGRVKFSQSTTPIPRSATSKSSSITIVTPEPEIKNISEILNSMRNYKTVISSTPIPSSDKDDEDSYTDSDDEENNFHFHSDFTDNEKGFSEEIHGSRYTEYSRSPFASSSSRKKGNKVISYNSFDDIVLTTPRNDYFDKKFSEISQDIAKNLERHRTTVFHPLPESLHNQKPQRLSVNKPLKVHDFISNMPSNNSQLYFHKSKSILVSDNDAQGSSLSDVEGTSIYFEHSLLSTESYGSDVVNEGDSDDCDESTTTTSKAYVPVITTPTTGRRPVIITKIPERITKTPPKRVYSYKTTSTQPTPATQKTNLINRGKYSSKRFQTYNTPKRNNFHKTNQDSDSITAGSHKITESDVTTAPLIQTTTVSEKTTVENIMKGTKEPSKRIKLIIPEAQTTSPTESPDKTTISAEHLTVKKSQIEESVDLVKNQKSAPRIQFTTPKTRVTHRMSVRRNYTESKPKPIYVSTAYPQNANTSETPERKQNLQTSVPTEIDPVFEPEIMGAKKIVHSQTISDNRIPGLRKRGSTRFGTVSTVGPTSTEENSGVPAFLTVPTASSSWGALAGMRNPPSLASSTNATVTSKNPDENELQNVAESSDKTSTAASLTTAIQDINAPTKPTPDQDWKPILAPTHNTTRTLTFNSRKPMNTITAKPLENPPTTQTLLTNELTGDTKPDSTVNIDETKTASGWIPVNTTEVKELAKTTVSALDLASEVINRTYSISANNSGPVSTEATADVSTLIEISQPTQPSKSNQVTPNISISSQSTDRATVPNTIIETASLPNTVIPVQTVPTFAIPTLSDVTESMQATITWLQDTETTDLNTDVSVTTYRPMYFGNIDTTTDLQTELVQVSTTMEPTREEPSTDNNIVTTREEPSNENNIGSISPTEEVLTETETGSPTEVEITTSQEIATTAAAINSSPENKQVPSETTQETAVSESITTEIQNAPETAATEVQVKETLNEETTDTAEAASTTVEEEATTVIEDITTAAKTEGRLEDLTNYGEDLTTHAPVNLGEESSSAAGVAIAVSTIGVIALLLVIGLMLVLRRRRLRGRRCGVYAQRCTPVSLDTYSLDSVSVRRKGAKRASKRSYGNPAYDDEVVISHPMQYAALANFALNGESIAAEFGEIPASTVRADEVPAGCEDKNRFSNVLPLPETRVPLQKIDGDPTSEYINANYVTGPGNIKNYYIACQAPLENTVADFWRMMWEQNSRVIVMLTEYMENGAERCYEYLPPSEVTDNKRTFGDFQITLKKREQYDKYAISSLQLRHTTTKHWREISHLWYFWPAKGVPDDYDSVINFMSEMRSHMKISQNAKQFDEDDAAMIEPAKNGAANGAREGSPGSGRLVYSPTKAEDLLKKGVVNGNGGTLGRMKAVAETEGVRPCVVMCASGAGRTGALLALDICARALESTGTVDVPRVVRSLRAARAHALQNKSQYIFLYKVLSEYGHKLNGGVDSI